MSDQQSGKQDQAVRSYDLKKNNPRRTRISSRAASNSMADSSRADSRRIRSRTATVISSNRTRENWHTKCLPQSLKVVGGARDRSMLRNLWCRCS